MENKLSKIKMYPDIDYYLDIMMPRLDGISVVHEVRKENAQLPILLLVQNLQTSIRFKD